MLQGVEFIGGFSSLLVVPESLEGIGIFVVLLQVPVT